MSKDIPYYVMDGEGNTQQVTAGEAYIDDGDLKELLIELLGDDISEEEIQKVLDAASDENLTEEEFDNLIDEFILKNKTFIYDDKVIFYYHYSISLFFALKNWTVIFLADSLIEGGLQTAIIIL